MDSNHQLSQKPSSSLAMKGPLGKMEYRARFGDFWRRQKSSQIQDSMGRKIDMCFSFWIFVQKWPQAVPWLLPCGFLRSDGTLSISNVALDNTSFLPCPLMSTSWLCLLWPRQTPLSLAACDGIFYFLYAPFVLNCARRKLLELSLPGGW